MPRPRLGELIECEHYIWMLRMRNGVYFADGRMNKPSTGRHSLGTKVRAEALDALKQLDRTIAIQRGKITRPEVDSSPHSQLLSLDEGRALYEKHVRRPRVAGGPRPATPKRYKAVLDKFLPFCQQLGITTWNEVNRGVLQDYAAWLEREEYAYATSYLELTTLKQICKWLTEEEHLRLERPIRLPLSKADGSSAYCWRPQEFEAMMQHCAADSELEWLRVILVGLATTGLRISELAGLRWSDIDLESNVISIKDESATPKRRMRRQARTTKTGQGRSFPLHESLRSVLEQMSHSADGRIFHGAKGGKVDDDRVRAALIRQVLTPLETRFPTTDDLGFADGRLHSFRHYFCSICANSGVPEMVVMRWLGHSNSRMVRHYYHLHDQESQRQMQRVDFGAGTRSAG